MPYGDTEKTEVKTKDLSPKSLSKDDINLWKKRYDTSREFYKKTKNKERVERIIEYLHNDFSSVPGLSNTAPFFNQFFIGLKTLIPLTVAHNPFVSVKAENDLVYEYGPDNQPIKGPDGMAIQHDITKTSETIQGLLKKRLTKQVDFRRETRNFLRDAITFNRGIFIVGHTANSEYKGAFNEPTFHAYLKSVPPYRIKRQAGTTRIDEGTYFFYEYELPLSHMKKVYDKKLLEKCRKTILEEVKESIDDTLEFQKEDSAGYYDDVQYIRLRNAYDLLTGDMIVFGEGCDEPLKVITPQYSFKNPSVEFIPNELFQPEQKEPVSDLMMGECIVKNAQVIIEKSVKHVQDFNTGYDVERGALLDKNARKQIQKGLNRSFRVWENNAVSGGKVRPRGDLALGPEPLNMVEYLFGYFQKLLAVYDFQQGGRGTDEETATKTQAKLQTSQFKGGDVSEMFSDACNKALDKYLEVLVKTTDTSEVVECIGDAGEVEYRPFNGDEAKRGQYYCTLDIQSMGKVNDDVKVQQALKLYEIIKSDPDPQVQQRINKVALVERLVKGLGLGNEGILRKVPDTQGMDEQAFRDYLKQQMIKAKTETQQAVAGAQILPPSPDDDDDIHLESHLTKAQELKAEAATTIDPMMQQKSQIIIERLVQHAQAHLERKRMKDDVEKRVNPGNSMPMSPQVPVADNPPMGGRLTAIPGGRQ